MSPKYEAFTHKWGKSAFVMQNNYFKVFPGKVEIVIFTDINFR